MKMGGSARSRSLCTMRTDSWLRPSSAHSPSSGLAGSYTRMLLKTESFNQVREERETLRKNYKQMAQIAHDRDVQVASLGALASEVTALYGLRQNTRPAPPPAPPKPLPAPTPQASR